ncbi:MAG TPA: MerR family transcriptional regulator [Rugosimonospora sp.]
MRGALRTGEVAAAAGVNVQTLRYYERRGLLPRPARTPGGHRGYPSQAVVRIRVIKAVQRLGFTLDEITDLLEAGAHGRPGLRDRAVAKVAEIDARIAALTTVRRSLVDLVEAGCDSITACSCRPVCPIPLDGRLDGPATRDADD